MQENLNRTSAPGFSASTAAGFGLVEIMVGLAVGVISMAVVMQVYSGFENQKRATTSGSDAQSNASVALYLMEREIKMAGNGMTEGTPDETPPMVGCPTWLFDQASGFWGPSVLGSTVIGAGAVTRVRLAPAVISDGGGGLTDTLSIAYGTSATSAPYRMAADFNAGAAATALTLNGSSTSVKIGDMIALVQQQNNPNNTLPRDCALLQATNVQAIQLVAGSDDSFTVTTAAGRYNNARPGAGNAGLFESASSTGKKAQAFNLGQLSIVTYRVVNGNLVADTSKFGTIAGGGAVSNSTAVTPLASGIVNMQIQYGVDTGNTTSAACNANKKPGAPMVTAADSDSIIDAPWLNAAGARWGNNGTTTPSIPDLRRVRAVRIGLVARSGVLEKDCATAPPTPNPIVISWDDGTTMNPDLGADPNWQCYRYKVYQTTISLRNTGWSSSLNPASASNCNN